MSGPLGGPPASSRWLAAQLALAPWLFWTCPPCWVMALLAPTGGEGARERTAPASSG